MAAKGYPGDYARGTRIEGLDEAAKVEGVEIFHAGTIARGRGAFSPMAGACSTSAPQAKPSPKRSARLSGGRSHQLAGRFLPPRHRLAGGGAGEGVIVTVIPDVRA
jgi:hypothetical protein